MRCFSKFGDVAATPISDYLENNFAGNKTVKFHKQCNTV